MQIYTKKIEDKNLPYEFTSNITANPLEDIFLIEEGVQELVAAFSKKGYLTYSSCEGHSPFSGKYVEILSPNLEFIKFVEDKLKMEDCSFRTKDFGDTFHLIEFGTSAEELRNKLNKLFNRDYAKYYGLQIILFNYPCYFSSIEYLNLKECLIDQRYGELIDKVSQLPNFPY